jgi:hypothetical protein
MWVMYRLPLMANGKSAGVAFRQAAQASGRVSE